MLRAVIAVIGAYIVMSVAFALILTVAFFALGTDRAYQAGTYNISNIWIGVLAVAGLVAALIGGFACAKFAKAGSSAPIGLFALVFVAGVATAIYLGIKADPGPRAGDVSVFDAPKLSVQPTWYTWASIPITLAGVFVGASLGCKKKAT